MYNEDMAGANRHGDVISAGFAKLALDQFADSAIWIDATGAIVYVNDAACKSVGYTMGEMLSMHIWDIDPNYREEKYVKLWIGSGGARVRFETMHIAKDGTVFPVEVTASRTKYGDTEYMVTFDRNIAERKRIATELANATRSAELYVDLMGHDLSNMHQVVMGYMELAQMTHPEHSDLFDKPMEVMQRSARLISNVRKLQKFREHRTHRCVVDLCKVLSNVTREFSVAGRTVELVMKDRHCPVVADDLLYDVFANVVSNAIQHAKSPTVHIYLTDEGKSYRVAVDDDGSGVRDELKRKLFSERGACTGTGIGLYMARTLVDSYKGSIWVEDRVHGNPARGARFVVELPKIRL